MLLTIGPAQIEQYKLHTILHAFAHDENLEVRKVISSSLHEVGSVSVVAFYTLMITSRFTTRSPKSLENLDQST